MHKGTLFNLFGWGGTPLVDKICQTIFGSFPSRSKLNKLNLNQPSVHEEEDQVISDEKRLVRRKVICFLFDEFTLIAAKNPSQ